MKNKFIWGALLFLASGLFVFSLFYSNYWLNIIVILLSVVIYKYGDHVLFKEYNEKMKEKREQEEELREATQTILSQRKLFKGGNSR